MDLSPAIKVLQDLNSAIKVLQDLSALRVTYSSQVGRAVQLQICLV